MRSTMASPPPPPCPPGPRPSGPPNPPPNPPPKPPRPMPSICGRISEPSSFLSLFRSSDFSAEIAPSISSSESSPFLSLSSASISGLGNRPRIPGGCPNGPPPSGRRPSCGGCPNALPPSGRRPSWGGCATAEADIARARNIIPDLTGFMKLLRRRWNELRQTFSESECREFTRRTHRMPFLSRHCKQIFGCRVSPYGPQEK